MNGGGWRAPEVCRLTGVTYRQLDYWARTALVRPSMADAHGSGSQRRYSDDDLLLVWAIGTLLAAGVSLQTVRSQMATLTEGLVRGDERIPFRVGNHVDVVLRTTSLRARAAAAMEERRSYDPDRFDRAIVEARTA